MICQCAPSKWPSYWPLLVGKLDTCAPIGWWPPSWCSRPGGGSRPKSWPTELEVSARTARRDLEGLAMAGIPVYSQPGRGGGWTLIGGSRTDLSGLTAAEARTLFLVAGPSTATPEVKAALRKLVQALPATFRSEAEAAASAVVLDPTELGPRPGPAARASRGAAAGGDRRRAGPAGLRAPRRRGVRARRAPVGPGGEEPGLVPHRRDRRRAAHLPGQPGPLGRAEPTNRCSGPRASISPRRGGPSSPRSTTSAPRRRCTSGPTPRRWTSCATCSGHGWCAGPVDADGRIEAEIRGHSEEMVARQLAGLGGRFEVLRRRACGSTWPTSAARWWSTTATTQG